MAELSTKPYLIRAIHEWCEDSGFRPYIAVAVDERTIVPREFVRSGEIVLNVSSMATNRLSLGNDLIEFEARFSGAVREVSIPVENVSAIYAQETGHGMAFDVPKALAHPPERAQPSSRSTSSEPRETQRPKLVPKPVQAEPAQVEPDASETKARAAAKPRAKVTRLQAVQAGDEAPKDATERASAPRRRRAKLAAVPTAAGEGDVAEPAGSSGKKEPASGLAPEVGGKDSDLPPPPDGAPGGGRPTLKRIK